MKNKEQVKSNPELIQHLDIFERKYNVSGKGSCRGDAKFAKVQKEVFNCDNTDIFTIVIQGGADSRIEDLHGLLPYKMRKE